MRWTLEQAQAWRKKVGWLVGCNYTPSNAVNSLEFWQAETFSPDVIDRELGLAAGLGMNSVRVFLHNLLWEQDADGFYRRINHFLSIAAKHGIGAMFVLFDSCWDPAPKIGKQLEPKPGVHNSRWIQAPGADVLQHPEKFLPLRGYVEGVIGRFKDDPRVHSWDIWNEPDNGNVAANDGRDIQKGNIILPFLIKSFAWARNARPSQPITGGPWNADWLTDDQLSPMNYFLLHESDIISFHVYGDATKTRNCAASLQRFGRPIVCTEYMARNLGSTPEVALPIFKELGVGAYIWGLVRGKTQTHLPWDSWHKPYESDPPVWFHEIFHTDGRPYIEDEVRFFRSIMQK